MVLSCCVKTCRNKLGDVKLHRLPREDKLLFAWLRRIGNPVLLKKDRKSLLSSSRVCDIHFSDECRIPGLYNKSNLKFGSVPTVAVPTSISGPAVIRDFSSLDTDNFEIKEESVSGHLEELVDDPDTNETIESNATNELNSCDYYFTLPNPGDSVNSTLPNPNCEESKENVENNTEEMVILQNIKLKLCRVCGYKNQCLKPIFEDSDPVNLLSVPVVKLLEMYLPLQISSDDQFPLHICSKCTSTLNEWHELYVTCVAANKAFRNTFCRTTLQEPTDVSPVTSLANSITSSVKNTTRVKGLHYKEDIRVLKMSEIPARNLHARNDVRDVQKLEIPARNLLARDHVRDIKVSEISVRKQLAREEQKYIKTKLDIQGEKHSNISENNVIITQFNDKSVKSVNNAQLDLAKCLHFENHIPCNQKAFKSNEQIQIQIIYADWKGNINALNESQEELNDNSVKNYNDLNRFVCKYCCESFKERVDQAAHYELCQETATVCEICGQVVKRRKNLYQHKYEKHGGKIFCDKCGKWISRSSRRKHMQSEHSEVGYCDLCCSIFRSKISYIYHMKKHADGDYGSTFSFSTVFKEGKHVYECPVCNLAFDDKTSIIEHLNKLSITKCPTCLVKFKNEKRFVLHSCKQWSCQYCSQNFYNRERWKDHERIHTGEKPYKCHLCNVYFRTLYQRTFHLRRHRTPTLQCKYCPLKFTHESKLRIHIGIHEGVRYICPICGQKFSWRSNVSRHLKKHKIQQMLT